MRVLPIIMAIVIAEELCSVHPLAAQVPGEVIAVQGLRGNTLVAGKSTAFRLFTKDPTYADANRIEAIIVRPDGSRFVQSWARRDFTAIPTSSRGSSLVVRVLGKDLPWIGSYQFTAKVYNAGGALLASYLLDRFQLLPTKDLIVAIDRVNAGSVNPGTAAEIQAARDSMQRLAGIWPVRDGISTPDGDRSAGLRYTINNNPQPYGCDGNPKHSDCQLCPFYATWLNRPANLDVMNLGIAYRFQDPGEDFGGIAPNFCPNQSVPWASVVMSGALAAGFGQETGHCFGLEPADDPHFDHDPNQQPMHSKDNTIAPLDAELGFDIELNQPFPSPVYDAMHQVPCGCSNDKVSYNSWDWEYLRKQFVKLSSTGPTVPAHFLTDAGPSTAAVGNSVYFLAKRVDGRVFYNWAVLGQAGQGWVEMEGNGHTDTAPAAAAIGTHIFVAVKGLDGRIYINQADLGKSFGEWFPMDFRTDVAPALASVSNRIFIFAKGLDQRIYVSQAVLRESFSGWFEVQGNGRTDAAPVAASIGSHVFVAVKGLDGRIYINQADLGKSFGEWFPMDFRTDVPPSLATVNNSVLVFAKGLDKRIQLSQAELGNAFSGWFEVQGNGRTDVSPAAAAVGNHVFVAIKGLDGHVYINQADFGKSFGQWFP